MFIEAKSSGQLDTGEVLLGNLRLVEVISNKIFSITRPEQSLESLQVSLVAVKQGSTTSGTVSGRHHKELQT